MRDSHSSSLLINLFLYVKNLSVSFLFSRLICFIFFSFPSFNSFLIIKLPINNSPFRLFHRFFGYRGNFLTVVCSAVPSVGFPTRQIAPYFCSTVPLCHPSLSSSIYISFEMTDEKYVPNLEKVDADSVPPKEREIKHNNPGRPDKDYDEMPVGPAEGYVNEKEQQQEKGGDGK